MDKVRFLIGDTDEIDPLFTDEEILATIATESNELGAAAGLCEVLATKFARRCDRKLGRVMYLFASQQYEHYQEQAKVLRNLACQFNAPSAGGLSLGAEEASKQDPDRKQPIFSRDMMASRVGFYPFDITE